MASFNPVYASVQTEGCDLHYWHQGSGPLLMMIPGGGGIGSTYNAIFPYLAPHFTVCTFDRRQNGKSTVDSPKHLNLAQQARDVVAIIKAMGREKACVFGNSGGALISLQLSVSYPQYLDRVVAHEAPTLVVLPDTTYHLDRAFMILDTYHTHGSAAAHKRFTEEHKGYEDSPALVEPSRVDWENFWQYEFIYFTIYCPDLRHIVKNGVSIAVGAGEKSGDAWYARTTLEQADILGCKHYVFAGHHGGFESEPAEFAPTLLRAFEELKR